VARVASPGLLSDKVIDLVEGADAQTLAPLSVIQGQESADLFAAVDEVAFEIKDLSANSIRPMLQKFSASVDAISQRIDNIGGELDKGIPTIIDNADRFLVELNRNVDRLSEILNSSNEQHLANTLSNMDNVSKNLVVLTGRLDTTIGEFESLTKNSNSVVENNHQDIRQSVVDLRKSLNAISQNIDSIIYNLDTTSRNFNEFSRQLRMNPGVLLGGSPPEDAGARK
jgi:phospholipid/cholesterol/gamma-HCH transport system substrate-binding protein